MMPDAGTSKPSGRPVVPLGQVRGAGQQCANESRKVIGGFYEIFRRLATARDKINLVISQVRTLRHRLYSSWMLDGGLYLGGCNR